MLFLHAFHLHLIHHRQVKEHYPHGYCGVNKEGMPVYYERLGMLNVKKVLEIVTEDREERKK